MFATHEIIAHERELHDECNEVEAGEEEKREKRHRHLFKFWNDCLNQKEKVPE